jgi:hypothetical protein
MGGLIAEKRCREKIILPFHSTAALRCRATSGQGDATICIKQSPSGLTQSQGAVARALREYGGHSCKVMLYMFCRSSVRGRPAIRRP